MKTSQQLLLSAAISLALCSPGAAAVLQGSALGFKLVAPEEDSEANDANEEEPITESKVIHSPQAFQEKMIERGAQPPPPSPVSEIEELLEQEKSIQTVAIRPPVSHKGSEPFFRPFPNDTPDIMPSNIKIELSDAQELIPEMSYSFHKDNFFSSISYQSLKTSTVANIVNYNDSLAGRNRVQRKLKLYPYSWGFKLNHSHMLLGAFYARSEMERSSFGLLSSGTLTQDTISFNNEVLLTGQHFGAHAAFYYRYDFISLRGFFDVPLLSQLKVSEKSLFRLNTDKTRRVSSSGDFGLAFDARLEALVRTPYSFDFNINAGYDATALSYRQTISTNYQNGEDIVFESSPYSTDISTLFLGAGLLLDLPGSTFLTPFIEGKIIRQSIKDSDNNGNLVINSYLLTVGFSNAF